MTLNSLNDAQNNILTSRDQPGDANSGITIEKPGSTPLASLPKLFNIHRIWMKDETPNPTHTFKDRLAYEMIRPLFEQYRAGQPVTRTTFASISYGNTAIAMSYYVQLLNSTAGYTAAKAIVFMPEALEERSFGPDESGKIVPARRIIERIKEGCTVLPINLSKKLYRSHDLYQLAKDCNEVVGKFIDVTEGLDRPSYVHIIIEAIEQQLKETPDYIIAPFGAGILCNEIMDYINDYQLHTKVIPVSSGDPNTIAVMLYGPIWVDAKGLRERGWGWTRHEKVDAKGRMRKPYKVYHVADTEIHNALTVLKAHQVSVEPSGAAGFAILPRLHKIDPEFNPFIHSVLIINTGNGLLNY